MQILKMTWGNAGQVYGSNVHLMSAYVQNHINYFSSVLYSAASYSEATSSAGWDIVNPPNAILIGEPDLEVYPAPISWEWHYRPVNIRFEERKRSGEMVVSEMHVRGGLVNLEQPIYTDTEMNAGPYRSFSIGALPGFKSLSDGNPWGEFSDPWGGIMRGFPTAFYSLVDRVPADIHYPLQEIADICVEAFQPFDIDGALIQGVHAEANSGTLDLLTALAELPETVRWIFDSFKTGRRIVSDFRHKIFALNDRTARRQKTLRERISRLSGLLSKDNLKSSEAAVLQREMKKLNQDLTYSIYELGEKTSSLWLQFRYALMPLIYTIKDALKVASNLNKLPVFRKFKRREVVSIDLNSVGPWSFEGDAKLTQRCWIKRALDATISFKTVLKNEFRGSVFATLWELKRLSFVWDWFITAGDAIAASCQQVDGVLAQVATYSQKLEVDGYYVHPEGGRIKVRASEYKRILIDPASYTGLYFAPSMDWRRQLDTLCLFVWPAIRKLFK